MKKIVAVFLITLLFVSGCAAAPEEESLSPETTVPLEEESYYSTEEGTTTPTLSETTAPPVPEVELSDEEKTMLLKLGMAERGKEGCTQCIALVMRTVLNRVEADRFGSSIRSVIFAPDQFTPVSDGSYDNAEPNEYCQEALELVIYGWDESQGALYYEWCEGESWHSQNLHLLFQHCDTRFYN